MKLAWLSLVSSLASSPIENDSIDKRAWMTGTKMFTIDGSATNPSTRVVRYFKIDLGSEAAAQYRYRLRFTQLEGYSNAYQVVISAMAYSNGIVRLWINAPDEEWNAAGRTYTLDRTIPSSGVWQDEKQFTVSCPAGVITTNEFTYAGVFSFTCTS